MYRSGCRNCKCLHYYLPEYDTSYPSRCYCPEAYSFLRCSSYAPLDNLEYIEWCIDRGIAGVKKDSI